MSNHPGRSRRPCFVFKLDLPADSEKRWRGAALHWLGVVARRVAAEHDHGTMHDRDGTQIGQWAYKPLKPGDAP